MQATAFFSALTWDFSSSVLQNNPASCKIMTHG